MQGPTARGTKSRERLERYEALKAQTGPTEKVPWNCPPVPAV